MLPSRASLAYTLGRLLILVNRFLVEELERAKNYNIVVLTRGHRPWFAERAGITVRLTDYSADSVRTILDDVGAVVLFSFIHDNSPFYNTTHEAFLAACRSSRTCSASFPPNAAATSTRTRTSHASISPRTAHSARC